VVFMTKALACGDPRKTLRGPRTWDCRMPDCVTSLREEIRRKSGAISPLAAIIMRAWIAGGPGSDRRIFRTDELAFEYAGSEPTPARALPSTVNGPENGRDWPVTLTGSGWTPRWPPRSRPGFPDDPSRVPDRPAAGRPFALYTVVRDSAGRPTALDVFYVVVGRGKRRACRVPPRRSPAVLGPLGNGFVWPPPARPVVFVAAGSARQPFLSRARLARAPRNG